jgi:hypothetical protein
VEASAGFAAQVELGTCLPGSRGAWVLTGEDYQALIALLLRL